MLLMPWPVTYVSHAFASFHAIDVYQVNETRILIFFPTLRFKCFGEVLQGLEAQELRYNLM